MLRNVLSVVVVLGVASMPVVLRAAPPFELKSVKIDLPDSDRMFPAGSGSDAMNNNCLAWPFGGHGFQISLRCRSKPGRRKSTR